MGSYSSACRFPVASLSSCARHVLLCCNGLKWSLGAGWGGVGGWGMGGMGWGGAVGGLWIGERQSWVNSGEESELISPKRPDVCRTCVNTFNNAAPSPTDCPSPTLADPHHHHHHPEAAPIKHSIKDVSQGAAWRNAV